MGLKGYRLWVMGQLDSTCRAPPRVLALPRGLEDALRRGPLLLDHDVALQVAFERQILKPVFSLDRL
jgi:hypothetical protein